MVSVFDEILETLKDGKYHSFDQVALGCRHMNDNQVEAAIAFLHEYGFVRRLRIPGTLTRIRKVRLTAEMLSFLRRLSELQNLEEREVTINVESPI